MLFHDINSGITVSFNLFEPAKNTVTEDDANDDDDYVHDENMYAAEEPITSS